MSSTDLLTAVEGEFHYYYGDKDMSDVVLLVGVAEFHVNRAVLANKSSFFKTLFYDPFNENGQSRVAIKDVDQRAFRHLMEVIYDGRITTDRGVFIDCAHSKEYCVFLENKKKWEYIGRQQELWKRTAALLDLADRFDLSDATINAVQDLFMWAQCPLENHKKDCSNEGVRQLLAMTYGMKGWMSLRRAHFETSVKDAIKNLRPIKPKLNLGFEAIDWMINEYTPGQDEHSRRHSYLVPFNDVASDWESVTSQEA